MSFRFACPKCGQRFRADDDWVGRTIECTNCHASVLVEGEVRAEAELSPSPSLPETKRLQRPAEAAYAANSPIGERSESVQKPSQAHDAAKQSSTVASRSVAGVIETIGVGLLLISLGFVVYGFFGFFKRDGGWVFAPMVALGIGGAVFSFIVMAIGEMIVLLCNIGRDVAAIRRKTEL